MSLELTLTGRDLTPERVARALADLSRVGPIRCALGANRDGAPVMLFWLALGPDDPDCARLLIAFADDGARLAGLSNNQAAALLDWSFRRLARDLACALDDPRDGEEDSDQAIEAAALDLLRQHEDASRLDRDYRGDGVEPAATTDFIDWLVASGKLVLAGDRNQELDALEALIDRPELLYQVLMDSVLVEELFLDPDELRDAIAEYSVRT